MYVTTLPSSIHQLKGCFHAVATVDRVAMSNYLRSGSGSLRLGHMVDLLAWEVSILIFWVAAPVCNPRKGNGGTLSTHPCQHLLSAVFLIWAIATGVKWTVKVVLIYISIIAQDRQTFFMLLLRYTFWELCTDPRPIFKICVVFLVCFLVIYIFWLLILLPDV